MHKRISRRNALKGTLAAAAGAAVGGVAPGFLRPRPKNNLLFIVADAFRGDRLGASRMLTSEIGASVQRASITPFLDEFAGSSAAFARAVSPSSWTPVSVGSVLHGVSPMKVYYAGQVVAEGSKGSFVREFARSGCHTSAVTANWVLNQDVFKDGFDDFLVFPQAQHIIERRWNFDFPPGVHGNPLEEYLWGLGTGERVNSMVETLTPKLRRSPSFLLYVHYMDNHEIYTVTRRLLRQLGSALTYGIGVKSLNEHLDAGRTDIAPDCPFEIGARRLEEYYDVSVKYLDEQVRALLATLRREGLLDDTTIIFTSDHGEEFLDAEVAYERYFGHASNLSFAQTHTPLVVASNAHPVRRGVIETPVENGAVVRAVGDAVLGRGDGALWSAVAAGAEPPVKPVWSYLDWRGFRGLACTFGDRRIHVRLDGQNGITAVSGAEFAAGGVSAAKPLDSAEVESLVADYVEKNSGRSGAGYIDEKSTEQLRALGYLN